MIFFAGKLPACDARRLDAAIISLTCSRTRQVNLPALQTVDAPRSYFNSTQYSRLHNRARALLGGEIVERDEQNRVQRYVRITPELNNLLLFMTNTFVRPTDIEVLTNS